MKALSIKTLLSKVTKLLNGMILTRDVSSSVTVGANTNAPITFTVPSIAGYTYIGIIGITNSHGVNFPITDFNAASHRAVVRNLTSTSTTVTLTGRLLFVKSNIVGGVLRNLSIFKPFSRFASLRKGGGVDEGDEFEKTIGKIANGGIAANNHFIQELKWAPYKKRECSAVSDNGRLAKSPCRWLHDCRNSSGGVETQQSAICSRSNKGERVSSNRCKRSNTDIQLQYSSFNNERQIFSYVDSGIAISERRWPA